jgi:hypothetical protein
LRGDRHKHLHVEQSGSRRVGGASGIARSGHGVDFHQFLVDVEPELLMDR